LYGQDFGCCHTFVQDINITTIFQEAANLAKQNSSTVQDKSLTQLDVTSSAETMATPKKQFVEPEVSAAVDVLEATTFFQLSSSGASN